MLKNESAESIGQWIFEEIVCHWGCLVEIVTDNGGPFKRAVRWLEQKYRIMGSPSLPIIRAPMVLLNNLIGTLDKCCTKLVEVTFLSGGGSFLMYFGQIAFLLGNILGVHHSLWLLERIQLYLWM